MGELSQDPHAWFRIVDWDGDGKLSREEVIRAMQAQLNLDMQKVELLIQDDGLWSYPQCLSSLGWLLSLAPWLIQHQSAGIRDLTSSLGGQKAVLRSLLPIYNFLRT